MKLDSSSTAFITGGAKGIGLGIAECILQHGGRVWIIDQFAEEVAAVQSALRAKYGEEKAFASVGNVKEDASLAKEFGAAVQQFKHVKLVVNNAGFGERIPFTSEQALKDEALPKNWEAVLTVSLRAVINCTRIAVAHFLDMKKAAQAQSDSDSAAAAHSSSSSEQAVSEAAEVGVVLNIASMGGLQPMSTNPVYAAAKHGVVGFTRSLGHLAASGIRVNALCPSFVDTQIVKEGMKSSAEYKKYIEHIVSTVGPLLSVQEVAEAAQLLVDSSHAASVLSISRGQGIAQHFVVPNTPGEFTKTIVPADKLPGSRKDTDNNHSGMKIH